MVVVGTMPPYDDRRRRNNNNNAGNNNGLARYLTTSAALPLPTLLSSLLLLLIGKKNRGKKRGNRLCCSVCNNTLHTLAILPLFTFSAASVHQHVLRKEFEGSSFRNSKTKKSGNCTQQIDQYVCFCPAAAPKERAPFSNTCQRGDRGAGKVGNIICLCAPCCVHQQAHNLLNFAARTCLSVW
jgi:hypothetical protein